MLNLLRSTGLCSLSSDSLIKYDFYTFEVKCTNPFSPGLGLCLVLMRKESVAFAYSINAIQRDSVEYERWHFLTSARHANAHAAEALLGVSPGREPVTLPHSL